MSKKLTIYVLILTCLPVFTLQCEDKFMHGKRFNGTSLQIIRNSRLFPCAADCVAYSLCKSVSFDRKKMTCFLHLEDESGHPDDLLSDPDFSYSPIRDWGNIVLGPCQKHSCEPHQKCVVKRKQKRCIDKKTILSRGKKTKASSYVFHNVPSNVVDGNRDPYWFQSGSCFHVNEFGGWWQVDLGAHSLITDVLIVNRGDCCNERLRNFNLETFTEDPSEEPTAEASLCYRHPDEVLAGGMVTFNCTPPVVGRYFRVSIPNPLDDDNKVQLCEVEKKTAVQPPLLEGMVSGETLDKFIKRKIDEDTEYLDRFNEVIDDFVRHLEKKDDAFVIEINGKKINVKRVLKSGSLGNGLAVKETGDIDLIIFLNGLSHLKELMDGMSVILSRLKCYVETNPTVVTELEFRSIEPFSVIFDLEVMGHDLVMKLLPAVDITETLSKDAIYKEMADEYFTPDIRTNFTPCLIPLQKQFLTSVPDTVKDFIRLLKYWAQIEKVGLCVFYLELLAISHWREDHKPDNFDMNIYFRQVMIRLSDPKSLAVVFDDNYDHRLFKSNGKKPYLCDPANPYAVWGIGPESMNILKRKSKEILQRL